VSCVGFEHIVSWIDAVEVNIMAEDNVVPQGVREIWAVLMDDEVVLGLPDINEVISFKQECKDNIWVENA